MPEVSHPLGAPQPSAGPAAAGERFTSIASIWQTLLARRRFVLGVVGGLLLLCLLYCLIAPKQYEARARVVLRVMQGSPVNLDGQSGSSMPSGTAGALLGMAEIETIVNVLRSDRLAWRVIVDRKLYADPDFNGSLPRRFPGFNPDKPSPEAQEYLLKRFHWRLHVSTVPRTLLIEIRFRTRRATLSAEIVNALITSFTGEEARMRGNETRTATEWLQGQLVLLKAQTAEKERQMEQYKREHGVLLTPGSRGSGQSDAIPELVEVSETSRELATAQAERILREARYKAALEGTPEQVLDTDTPMLADDGSMATESFKRLKARRSDLDQEMAQLTLEHGPNYSRVAELRRQLADLDKQFQTERDGLMAMLRKGLEMAREREDSLRARLAEESGAGEKATDAAVHYEEMAMEAAADQELYLRVQAKLKEAGLEAGVHPPDLWVVDPAIVPGKPAAPDLPLYMAITLFVSLWVALGGAFLLEALSTKARQAVVALLLVTAAVAGHAQSPNPEPNGMPAGASGMPSGLTHKVTSDETRQSPDPRLSPQVWSGVTPAAANLPAAGALAAMPPAELGPGDLLDVSEFHAPEFHSQVRVSEAGMVVLPMIGEVKVVGLDEEGAAKAIASALVEKGILLHPQVFVLVTAAAGQDVSVLGEVAHPGVYPFTVHHRLLDLIAAASGLAPTAGGVVGIFHRADPNTPHIIELRGDAKGADDEHNPELLPGDTVQVSKAGLVYVVGGVMRPGGFAMDPQQKLTVLQALSLAWGPSQSAATKKAVLIREQQGGARLVTALNIHRMLRGQDPDPPLHEKDILFIPDSLARSIWSRSVEAAVQSAAGVALYAGMVYSARF